MQNLYNKINLQYTVLLLCVSLVLFGCDGPQAITDATPASSTLQVIQTRIITEKPDAPTISPTVTKTPTTTFTPTASQLPTFTPSSTASPTPTSDLPQVRVLMQAFCRYGPGKAYLYSHGLYEGDLAMVEGRNSTSTWLWIQPQNLDRHCWMAASVAEVRGDVKSVPIVTTLLPRSTLYGPPTNIQARREGEQVIISWDPVWMTEDDDRGYLIEAYVCQNGNLIFAAVQTDKPKYTFTDHKNCSGSSGGKLYTVEKHGYTDPVTIPWP